MAEFRTTSRSRDVGDPAALDAVAAALLRWDIHRAAGFRVETAPDVRPGAVVVGRAPIFRVRWQCEVTEVFDEPHRKGFTYRTLPGHPLEGEETFIVEIAASRAVFTVAETSRPARLITRLPRARLVQGRINERYLDAAERVGATVPHS